MSDDLIGAIRDTLGIGGAAEAEGAPTTESTDPSPRAAVATAAIGRTMRAVLLCMRYSPLGPVLRRRRPPVQTDEVHSPLRGPLHGVDLAKTSGVRRFAIGTER